jgi:hypothetical protein
MRQFRWAVVALLTSLFVLNAGFLRKSIAVLLCGLLSFNPTACYGFLERSEVATAAVPTSINIDSSESPNLTPISDVSPAVQQELILAANQSPVSLEGKWQSEWGVVEFNSNLTGRWNQGGGIGQITSGSYDPRTRKLVFQYYQPWNNMTGTGTFTLSEDDNRLSGTWSQQPRGSNRPGSGGSGGWTMTRITCKSNVSLTGKWQSDWGQVEFNSNLSGSWNQPGSGVGQIKSGSFDSKKCELVFQYYQSWNDMDGIATLILSWNGDQLAGNWIQQRRGSNQIGSGGSGRWIMNRNSQNVADAKEKEPRKVVPQKSCKGGLIRTNEGKITSNKDGVRFTLNYFKLRYCPAMRISSDDPDPDSKVADIEQPLQSEISYSMSFEILTPEAAKSFNGRAEKINTTVNTLVGIGFSLLSPKSLLGKMGSFALGTGASEVLSGSSYTWNSGDISTITYDAVYDSDSRSTKITETSLLTGTETDFSSGVSVMKPKTPIEYKSTYTQYGSLFSGD